jgi:Protein of unknown function (DUF550)
MNVTDKLKAIENQIMSLASDPRISPSEASPAGLGVLGIGVLLIRAQRLDFGNQLHHFQDTIEEWSLKTFKEQPVQAKLKHMHKEIVELIAEPSDLEEWADLLILMAMCLRMQNITFDDLMAAAWAKHQKNMMREWNEPDEDGVIQHKDKK